MTKKLDERKLKIIKIKVIELEKNNIIRKESRDSMEEAIRKYIEKVVEGKC